MARATERGSPSEPASFRTSRIFPVRRELVFKAWSTADHIKRWFCPTEFTIPEATVEMREGGVFELCMRAPDGAAHWVRGTFSEVSPFDRLVLDLRVEDMQGHGLFKALTAVNFADASGGTRMDVEQSYTVLDPEAAWMTQGAPEGWGQTLDKLADELVRMEGQSN
ncbi:SRPBCC family protein [Rhodoligotrophos ferricapiens]|uniref:SRPBCC family protein n=1 Tax=Rhodoligotrophos ferricapiens TaxID=3069264 RepID=UPI00315D985E